MNIGGMLEWLYPQASPGADYRLEQRGEDQPVVIAAWSVAGEEQPTTDYLASREAEFLALPPNWRTRAQAVNLAAGGSGREVLLRGVLMVIRNAIAQDRAYMAALAAEITKLGGKPPAAPTTRSFAELVSATVQAIRNGAGDSA